MIVNADLAQLGADTGMALAASHADRMHDDWTKTAAIVFKLYAKFHPSGFLTEDVRVWSDKLGLPKPPDQRAWGAVAARLAKEGYIQAAGYERQRSATCHRSPKTVWKLAA